MLEQTLQYRGTVLDLPPDEIQEGAWSYTENIFFRDMATQRVGGYAEYYYQVGENPVFLYPVQRKASALWLIVVKAGADAKVIRWDGSSAVTIHTYTGLDPLTVDWQGTDHNGVIILNNGIEPPRFWNEVGGTMDPLPGWPADVTCRSIRSFKFHLFALGLANLTQENDYEFMWSDASQPNTIPQRWDAAPETDAGNSQLASPQGFIVDGIVLRDALMILKDFSAHIVQYTGGVFVFNQRSLYISAGMINPRCAVELNGRAMIATQDDLVLTDGNSLESICTHQVRRYIFNNINPESLRYCSLVKRHLYDECWFCYPKGTATYATEAAVYNTRTKRWGFRPLPEVSCLGYGLVNDPGAKTTWDSRDNSWEGDSTRWDERFYSNTADEIVMAAPFIKGNEGKVWVNDRGFTADGNPIDAEVKREGVLLGDDATTVKYLNELTPHVLGRQGDIMYIQVGGAMDEDGPISWSPAVPYEIGNQKHGKVDVHAVGRWMAFRFYTQGGATWRMYNFRVRYKTKGRF